MYDTIIVGAGCAGLAAAMYAGRLNMNALLIGDNIGGTITFTDVVENYPGFVKLSGQDLADNLRRHAETYNIETAEIKASRIIREHECFVVESIDGMKFQGKTIIFACV